jgi:hypothetical protein
MYDLDYWRAASNQILSSAEEETISELKRRPFDADLRKRVAEIYSTRRPYQARDWKVVDYNLVKFSFSKENSRHPTLVGDNGYFVVLGSAATFGSASQLNYGELLAQRTGLNCINLGMAGGGPEHYLENMSDEFWDICCHAKFVVLEFMSPSSVSNSQFTIFGSSVPGGRSFDPQNLDAARTVYRELAQDGQWEELRDRAGENGAIYQQKMEEIVARISAPVIGLWLSRRAPDQCSFDKPGDAVKLTHQFPQLLDSNLFANLRKIFPEPCISATDRGESFALDRFSLMPTAWWNDKTTQNYYPSPGMHIETADRLEEHLKLHFPHLY